jgi:hypothetical protein
VRNGLAGSHSAAVPAVSGAACTAADVRRGDVRRGNERRGALEEKVPELQQRATG